MVENRDLPQLQGMGVAAILGRALCTQSPADPVPYGGGAGLLLRFGQRRDGGGMNGFGDAITLYLLYLFLVYVQRGLLAYVCMYATYMPGAYRGPRMASNPQILEL